MIEITGLHKSFGSRILFQGLDLRIPDQKITVILGKSGVGKSMLLKHILGLTLPDSGSICIEGTDITALNERERRRLRLKFGMVFQHSALLDSLTVEENVGLGLKKLTRQPDAQISQQVYECLKAVGMEETGSLLPENLSGGMRKRAAFARAIIMNPPYLLYDEPTTGLDPTSAKNICNLIVKFNRTFQTTSVVVTHDVAATLRIADQIVLMGNGDIQAEYSSPEFMASENPLARSFMETFSISAD